MPAHPVTRSPVIRREPASFPARITTLAMLALGLGMLAGCGSLPPAPLAGGDPADPASPVRAQAYRSTVGPYAPAHPAEAGAWQDTNERTTPQVKP